MTSPPPSYVVAPPAYRLPGETRVGVVRLQVADLDRSRRFYSDALGFGFDRHEGGAVVTAADGAQLAHLTELRGAAPVPQQGRLGLYHYAILLPSRAALGRFLAHAALNKVRVGSSDHGVSEALYLRDPDGHGIEVYADRPREEWPIERGTLEMTTAPLDLDSLVDAGSGAAWNGAPEGTRVGHVHLHVGDLRDAKAFYHDALGLDVVARMAGALFMSAGGYHHHLGVNTWAAGSPPAGPDEARLIEWTLVLPRKTHADEAAESVSSAGYDARRDGDDWLAADPWGTTVRITSQPV